MSEQQFIGATAFMERRGPADDDEVALVWAKRRIEELENQLASGVHTCSNRCQRPMCVLRRRAKSLEDVLASIHNAAAHRTGRMADEWLLKVTGEALEDDDG